MSVALEIRNKTREKLEVISKDLYPPIFDAHVHVHSIDPFRSDEHKEKLKMYERLDKLEEISSQYNVKRFCLIITLQEDKYREEIKERFPESYIGLYITSSSIIETHEKKLSESLANYNFIKMMGEDFYFIPSKDFEKFFRLIEDLKGDAPNIIQIHTSPYFLGQNEFRSFINLLISRYGMKVHLVHGIYALSELERENREKAENVGKWIVRNRENIVLGTSNFIPMIELMNNPVYKILYKYKLYDNTVFESDLHDSIPLENWKPWFIDSLKAVLASIRRLEKNYDKRRLMELILFENAERFYSKRFTTFNFFNKN